MTPACRGVVRYMETVATQIDGRLDGSNLEGVRKELGVRLHRTILDHLMRFEYNPTGGLFAYLSGLISSTV